MDVHDKGDRPYEKETTSGPVEVVPSQTERTGTLRKRLGADGTVDGERVS